MLWPIPGLLHSSQLDVYKAIASNKARTFVLEIARRWGKTWLLVLLAFEQCLRQPRSRVVFGAPTLKHLVEFVLPTFDAIALRAPPHLRPRWQASLGHWTFANGSYVHLFGADDRRKAERGRGPEAQLVLFDEAGFTSVLDYVLQTVLEPQTWHSGGRKILSSTPAAEPEHPFTAIAEVEEAAGNYQRKTIFDNPRLSPERVATIIAESARERALTVEQFQATAEYRREFLAERVVEKSLVVVPEWAAARAKQLVALPRPERFNAMTILDFGGADPHAAGFGHWDFGRAGLVFEDEVLLRNSENTGELVQALKAKERALWGTGTWDGSLRAGVEDPSANLTDNVPDWMVEILRAEAPEQPFARWADNNLQLVHDLYDLHGMAFIPTSKDEKELQVNALRVLISAGQLFVHPRCVNLDRHLRTTTWLNEKRRDFRRTSAGEHGDFVDMAVYAVRNLDRRNPYPPGYALQSQSLGARALEREASDFGADLLGATTLGRKLLRGRR